MTSGEKIAVIIAQDEGKIIEVRNRQGIEGEYPVWTIRQEKHNFNFTWYDYRIKPAYLVIEIAGHRTEVRPDGLQVGCTFVPKADVAKAYYAITW